MMRTLIVVLIAALWAGPADAQDMFPVHECVIYASPDVRQWPVTVQITGITLGPGHDDGGLSFQTVGRDRWPNYEPPGWAGGGEGLQYTAWAARYLNGQWHCAGVVQFWRSRKWSGAPWPDEWGSWFYDSTRWGPLTLPLRVGERVCVFITAGNARKGSAGPEPDVTSVRERSNSVCWAVPAVSQGQLTFDTSPAPVPPPVLPGPGPGPGSGVTPPAPTPDAFLAWSRGFEVWARDYADWTRQQNEYQSRLLRDIQDQNERIFADLSRQIAAASTVAPTEPVKVDQGSVRNIVSLILAIAGAVGGGIAAVR